MKELALSSHLAHRRRFEQPGSLEVTATGFTPSNPMALDTQTLHMLLPLSSGLISGCRRGHTMDMSPTYLLYMMHPIYSRRMLACLSTYMPTAGLD